MEPAPRGARPAGTETRRLGDPAPPQRLGSVLHPGRLRCGTAPCLEPAAVRVSRRRLLLSLSRPASRLPRVAHSPGGGAPRVPGARRPGPPPRPRPPSPRPPPRPPRIPRTSRRRRRSLHPAQTAPKSISRLISSIFLSSAKHPPPLPLDCQPRSRPARREPHSRQSPSPSRRPPSRRRHRFAQAPATLPPRICRRNRFRRARRRFGHRFASPPLSLEQPERTMSDSPPAPQMHSG